MSTKQQREMEAQLHEQVYNNIFLLTLKHVPPESFSKVFKKDMFMKNNKVAFQQVVYYLLNILNPATLTQKITEWPIYSSRNEAQFRTEVMKYLNELNSLYEDANIPTILISHLVSPGGYKFMKFMLKLSQLVLYEELKKNQVISKEMLHRIMPNKNPQRTQITIQKLKGKARAIDEVTRDLLKQFEGDVVEYKEKAEGIMKKQMQLNAELPGLTHKLATLQQAIQHETYSDNEVDAQIESLQNKTDYVSNFNEKLKHLHGLVTLLCSGDLYLDGHSVDCTNDELNLLDFLCEFNELLNKRCLEMRVLTKSELSQSLDKYSALNEEMQRLLNGLSDIRMKLSEMNMSLKQHDAGVKDQSAEMSTTLASSASVCEADSMLLAVPLEDTPDDTHS